MPTVALIRGFFFSAPLSCSAGWTFYGTSCYKFSSLQKNWNDAKKDCRTSGGYLVKIDNGDEQHFITYRLRGSYRVSGMLWIKLQLALGLIMLLPF